MALMKCPECGRENVSDKAIICPNCGYKIKEKIEYSPKHQKKKCSKSIICVIGICMIGILFVVGIGLYFYIPYYEYNSALESYNNGKYKIAYDYFRHSNYKDSENYLIKTIESYTKQLLENKKIYTIQTYIETIEDKNEKETVLRIVEEKIEGLIEDKDFDASRDFLILLEDEEKKGELEKKLTYYQAVDNYEKGNFVNAVKLFMANKNYKDSNDMLQKAQIMRNLQGEWTLEGTSGSILNKSSYLLAKIYIDGWKASMYHGSKEKATTILEIIDNERVDFKTDEVEYNFLHKISSEGDILALDVIKDSYFEKLLSDKECNKSRYLWSYYEDMFAFKKDN